MLPSHILDAFKKKNFAAIMGYISTIKALNSVRDTDGNTLIHLAALHNFPEIIFSCAEEWPNDISAAVNMKNYAGDTPIHLAVQHSRVKKNPNDIDYQDSCYILREQYLKTKSIVFTFRVGAFPYDVFVLLWILGADVNMKDKQGNTPLHIATELYRGTGMYSYDCENHSEIEALSKILITLVSIFDADQTIANEKGLSFNDLMADTLKGKGDLAGLASCLAEVQMTKLIREFGAGKLNLEESICAAQKLGRLMPLADCLYNSEDYSNAYRVYQLIESQDPDYVRANERRARILLCVGAEAYAQFPSREKQSYEEALFTASLLGRMTDLAINLYQSVHQQSLLLEKENTKLKQELHTLCQPQEFSSGSGSHCKFWSDLEGKEQEISKAPPTVSKTLSPTKNLE